MKMYLVMMPNSWGKGATLAEAEKKARREGNHRNRKLKRLAFSYDPEKTPECYINEWGNICWSGDKPERINLD